MFYVNIAANLGGTLGLCLGASVLTICEFFEFALIKVQKQLKCCSKKLDKNEQ